MISKVRQLPTRAVVAVQNRSVEQSGQESSLRLALSSARSRAEVAVGAVLAYLLYASTTFTALAQSGGSGAGAGDTSKATSGVLGLIGTFTNFLILLLAAGSLLMGIFAALQFVGSGGSERVVTRAKSTIKNVVIGLCLAAGIFVIKKAVISVIGAPKADGGDGTQMRKTLDSGFKLKN